jgi:flotillin
MVEPLRPLAETPPEPTDPTDIAPLQADYAQMRLPEIAAQWAAMAAETRHDVAILGYAEEVAGAEARRDLAYDLAVARTEQALVRERVGVARVEREARIEVEAAEIERKTCELVHSVHRPAEAERYRTETLAEGERHRSRLEAEAEAEAIRARGLAEADVLRAKGLVEAEVIRQKALAEAEGLRARWVAEADGMAHKAAAWERYTAPAIAQILIEHLPEIAAAVSRPLENVDRIAVVSTGEGETAGLERITQSVMSILSQLPGMGELLQSANLGALPTPIPPAAKASPHGHPPSEPGVLRARWRGRMDGLRGGKR